MRMGANIRYCQYHIGIIERWPIEWAANSASPGPSHWAMERGRNASNRSAFKNSERAYTDRSIGDRSEVFSLSDHENLRIPFLKLLHILK